MKRQTFKVGWHRSDKGERKIQGAVSFGGSCVKKTRSFYSSDSFSRERARSSNNCMVG